MLRAILVIVGLAAVVALVLIWAGMLRVEQTSSGTLPSVHWGRAPQFKAETGKVDLGTTTKTVRVPTVEMKNATVSVPTLEVQKAGNSSTPAQ